MKLSMWMIAEALKQYDPKYDIKDGTACITGIRFVSGIGDNRFEPHYVYLIMDPDSSYHNDQSEGAVLINGRDIIVLQGRDLNELLNDLLAVFDFYNAWETSLWEASARKSFQQVIDLGTAALKNPIMLSDMDGNVLAMSSTFASEDINDYWVESRTFRHVPTAILGTPMRTADGTLCSWNDVPQIYFMPDGTKLIGAFLQTEDALAAGLGLWEYRSPIRPSDLALFGLLCEVLTSMIDTQTQHTPMRSSAAIIADLLSGVQIEDELITKLQLKCKAPWQLLVIDNPFRSDEIYKRTLIQRLQTAAQPCIPLIYEDRVVVLVSQYNADALLNAVLGVRGKQYYLAACSLPFDDLRIIPVRYQQTAFILQDAKQPGIYDGARYALPYLLSLLREQNQTQGLIHPALDRLKQHDAEKHSELYDTLYQYLLHERGINETAQAMHIHKNSLMYRLQRIRAILELDLDDPLHRNFLLLSYFLDRSQSPLS